MSKMEINEIGLDDELWDAVSGPVEEKTDKIIALFHRSAIAAQSLLWKQEPAQAKIFHVLTEEPSQSEYTTVCQSQKSQRQIKRARGPQRLRSIVRSSRRVCGPGDSMPEPPPEVISRLTTGYQQGR